jgi:hypothetical protein
MKVQPLLRWWPLAAVMALLVAAALAAAHSTPQLDRIPRADSAGEQETPPPPPTIERVETIEPVEQAAEPVELPGWLPVVINAALLVLVAAVLVVLVWGLVGALFRRRGAAPDDPDRAPLKEAAVLAAVQAGLDDLSDRDRDPRRAVIACWLRLEEAAAAAGLPRHVGDTSTDLVVRLLGGDGDRDGDGDGAGGGGRRVVSADVLAGFAEVYREARYATHTVDERMRGEARSALERLRAELTVATAPS